MKMDEPLFRPHTQAFSPQQCL